MTEPEIHQMPTAWDGVPVTWTSWTPGPTICGNVGVWDVDGEPIPSGLNTCSHCYLPSQFVVCHGKRQYDDPIISRFRNRQDTPDDFRAWRCTICGGTDVHDLSTGDYWVLGPEDYGPRGSYLQEVADD